MNARGERGHPWSRLSCTLKMVDWKSSKDRVVVLLASLLSYQLMYSMRIQALQRLCIRYLTMMLGNAAFTSRKRTETK